MSKPSRNGDRTQEKILNAARELFVEHGYTGVSMGKIAAKAGVNHSLLFHHFKNKLNLWAEVKISIVKGSTSAATILPPLDLSLREFTSELIKRGVQYYRSNPDLVRLMNWQRLETGSDQPISLGASAEMQNWITACQHYQKKGEIDPTLKPEFVLTFALAIVSSSALDPSPYIKTPDNFKAYLDFCVDRIVTSLKGPAAKPA